MAKNLLLEACKEYIVLFQESDMFPEPDCHELYTKMVKAVESAKDHDTAVLSGKPAVSSFHVPKEFIPLLREVAKSRGVRTKTVFKELVEQMTEELRKEIE